MAHFKNLRDVCLTFEEDLLNINSQLHTARIGKSFEDEIADKLRDLSLFTAKLRLLQAKSLPMHPQVQNVQEEVTLAGYEDAATWKVIEQQTVKAVTQTRDVRALIASPDCELDPALHERRDSIISKLEEYRCKEQRLSELDAMLKSAESERLGLQAEWDRALGDLRDLRGQAEAADEETGMEGPLYNKLKTLVDKIEMMRWLVSRLVTARSTGYDWMSDPHKRLAALKLARESNSIEFYTGM